MGVGECKTWVGNGIGKKGLSVKFCLVTNLKIPSLV